MGDPAPAGAEPPILRAFRAILAGADPLAPAQSPEGRFHHSGQWAIRRYLRADDPPRVVVPLALAPLRLTDLRGRAEVSAV